MQPRAAIVGVGWVGFSATSPSVSYKEMMFEAATKAYADAGIDPRRDVGSFVSVSEDFWEGTSIFDEYVPDQLGAMLRPVHTIGGDGIHGLAAAHMQILTGAFDVVVVESHSKASNVVHPERIINYALDPVLNRPLGLNPHYIAGLEMSRFLHETGTTREQCARVVVKNRANALDNPSAAHPARLAAEDVLAAGPLAYPLGRLDVAPTADGCIVLVIAGEQAARRLRSQPVWIRGLGWSSDTPSLEMRNWAEAAYARQAADRAYKMAGIQNPRREIDVAEVDDAYSYKELQHLEALRLCRRGEAGLLTEEGATARDGELPVNPSGGNLGMGHLLDASGLARVLEVVLQLRGQASKRQVPGARVGIAQGWRGVPTTTGAVVVLEAE